MIRQYDKKDRTRVERICLPTPFENKLYDEAILKCFCAYYIERTPEFCFVATNEEDEAVGYVLCAPDFLTWKEDLKREYMEKSDNLYLKAIGEATIKALEPFAGKYPAHLHIDIDENYRGQHLGTKLIAELLKRLKSHNICGVMLDVANDNVSAQGFYIRQGFVLLHKGKDETVMGIKL